MNGHDEDQAIIAATRAVLDRSVEDLEPQIAARLQRARHRAVEARPRSARWWLAGGVAAAVTAGLAGVLWLSQPANHLPLHDLEEIELVTTVEALEFYDELEFYRWLATHDSAS